MVAEADESDASFMLLRPHIAMVTNIDEDHMHTYDHDLRRLEQSFLLFLQRLPADGLAVLCWEDAALRAVSRSVTAPVLTYGFSDLADVWATEIKYEGMCSHFMVHGLPGQPVPVPMTLALPGAHNVLNALGVLAVAAYLQLPMQACQQALKAFCGVGRRSQYHGQFCLQGKRYHLLEDYGHHPKEIEVTVEALKNAWPEKRLVLVFQPHRYTRTQALWTAFCEAMATADALLLCEIYPAGEDPIPGFDVQMLISYLKEEHDLPVRYVPSLSMIEQELGHVIQEGDVVLLQGAGTIHSAVKAMVASKTQVEATREL